MRWRIPVWTLAPICLLFLLNGCFRPSSGGVVHVPPARAKRNAIVPLSIKFTAAGATFGKKITERYTHIRLCYRTSNNTFEESPGILAHESEKEMEVQFNLPTIAEPGTDHMEYDFRFSFDGYDQSTKTYSVSLE